MMRKDAERLSNESFMTIIPLSSNHCIIFGRSKSNYIEVSTDCAASDQIFISTLKNHYTIDDEGNIRKDY